MEPDDPRHGTTNGYINLGCRCEPCRLANNAYCKQKRKERVQRLMFDPTLAVHGKAPTYGNWGCRCAPCTDAWRKATYNRKKRT